MKNYVVLFIAKTSNKMGFDVFLAANAEAAASYFYNYYRRDEFQIITIAEKPEVQK